MLSRVPSAVRLRTPRFDATAAPASGNDAALRLLEKKVEQLERDNRKQRIELRAYKEFGTVEDIKKKIPAEDSVVLSAADAAVLKQYQELGKPEELKTKLEAGEKAIAGLATHEHRDAARSASKAEGNAWRVNADALLKLPGVDKLKFEVRKEKVDGKDVDVAYVTDTATQGAQPKKLTEWVEASHSEFLPALKAEAADQTRRNGTHSFPAQRSTTAPAGSQQLSEDEVTDRKLRSDTYTSL